jgi:hypothetical protein
MKRNQENSSTDKNYEPCEYHSQESCSLIQKSFSSLVELELHQECFHPKGQETTSQL